MKLLRARAPKLAIPQEKLDTSRHPVSRATVDRLNTSFPLGPPAVMSCRTTYVAKNAENITTSLSRKTQKPKAVMMRLEATLRSACSANGTSAPPAKAKSVLAVLIARPPSEQAPRGVPCGLPDRCGRPLRPECDIHRGRATRRR